MNNIYFKEFNNRENFLEIHLNEYLTIFQEYCDKYQLNSHLKRNKKIVRSITGQSKREKFVDWYNPEDFIHVGTGTFQFEEDESVRIANISVDETFQRNHVASFIIKYFLERYYPDSCYNKIWSQARSFEGKSLLLKMGFEIFDKDKEYQYWFMEIIAPQKIELSEEYDIDYITERIKDIKIQF